MSLETILAGIGTLEKFIPVVEAVGAEIGPLVKEELTDGEVIWADMVKCFNDFKGALAAIKTVAASSPTTPPAK